MRAVGLNVHLEFCEWRSPRADYPLPGHPDIPTVLIYAFDDEIFEPDWERFMARELLGIEPIEIVVHCPRAGERGVRRLLLRPLGLRPQQLFRRPGGGATLTTHEHRRMLHQVVQDVKSGGYSTSASVDCSAATPGGMRNPTVVILGHSAGGWIVAGYPGTYHDVAAMIQTSIFATTDGAAAQSNQTSQGGHFDPNPDHPDYFDFFHTSSDCVSFNTYPPGAVQSVVDIACTPPFIPSPFGEITDLGPMLAENDAAITQIGPGTPVLLAAGDHDTTAPPEKVTADYAYYTAHCQCDVSRYTIQNSGHLWQVHTSLPQTVDEFVSWLSSRGLPPTSPGGSGR